MELLDLRLKNPNNFLNTYIATYRNNDNEIKEYEIISRKKDLKQSDLGTRQEADAVGMIILNSDKSKILLQKEFRLACNSWVYNFPGGMIDEGETPEQAAKRELFEETGLELYKIDDILNKAYTATAMSDETAVTVIGRARGNFGKSSSANEEIEPKWYSKDEILKLFDTKENFSLRTQSFLYLWARS